MPANTLSTASHTTNTPLPFLHDDPTHTTNTPLPFLHDDPTHTTSTILLLPHIFFRRYYMQLDGRLLYLLLPTHAPPTPLAPVAPPTQNCPSNMLTQHITPVQYYSYPTPSSKDTTSSLTADSSIYSCQHTHHTHKTTPRPHTYHQHDTTLTTHLLATIPHPT